LELPSIGEHDALFCFLNGLEGQAQMELKKHGLKNSASIIATSESLIEFKREFSKE